MWTMSLARRNSWRAISISKSAKRKFNCAPGAKSLDRREAVTCQIAAGYDDCTTAFLRKSAANLQTDSRQYQAALKLAVKLVIRTAAKHPRMRSCANASLFTARCCSGSTPNLCED